MAQVHDPVCGMTVDPASSTEKSTYESKTYHFCSTDCKRRFDAEPGKYAISGTARKGSPGQRPPSDVEVEAEEPPHTSTGLFTAPKFGSAGSGGAEYEPAPKPHDDPRSK